MPGSRAERLNLAKQLSAFGPHSLGVGVLLIVLGSIGILLPTLMSIATVGFVSGLLILGGALWAYHTYRGHPDSVADWLKAVLLLAAGGLMLVFPLPGVAAVAMLITFYLLTDAFGSFSLAHRLHPDKGWGWMLLNGIADVLLATLFMVGWPATSLWLVGLFVGISLVFDGWALIAIGWAMRRAGQAGGSGPGQ